MIELSEMVQQLRQELNTAMSNGPVGPVRFELGPVEIETTVAVERTAGAGGKVHFWVVEANAEGKFATSQTHRISLTLQPKLVAPDGTQHPVLISGDEVDNER
ncbi:hypothetical protein J7F03_36720 [Streptomyces sp. ISL-43]|uniref:trypco2 family protein n=1 Tax=Streptomyces sp. ISL-43 TaxID=2819183 RepID=UPI001BE6E688|nr:trypco2 family protein [Streptomyces sp. ISL-43]MBT2452503.1 hypothetical protein [Streptomyces sp. ISL-43]